MFGEKHEFQLGSFSFYRDREEHPLDRLEKEAFFNQEVAKNVHRFFREIELITFPIEKRRLCPDGPVYSKVYWYECMEDCSPWSCHISAPYVATRTEWNRCVFGFAGQNVRGQENVFAMLHSFNTNEYGDFIDPTFEAASIQEASWARIHKWERPRLTLDDFHSYTGVVLPIEVVSDILWSRPGIHSYGNLWGYLLKRIFHDREKTDWFIGVVNGGGYSWQYEEDPVKVAKK